MVEIWEQWNRRMLVLAMVKIGNNGNRRMLVMAMVEIEEQWEQKDVSVGNGRDRGTMEIEGCQ